MAQRPIIITITILLSVLYGCGEEETVLVNVGDGTVTVEDLQRSVMLMGNQGTTQEASRQGRERLLERTIQAEVLYQAALASGVDELPDVQAQVEQAVRDILIGNFLRISFANYGFSEDDLFDYYQEHTAELVSLPQANARHILLDDEAEAREVIAELQAGANFAKLADTRSKDRMSGMNGGRLPVVRPDNQVLPPHILETIFNAEEGEPFGPLESHMGWHVLVVDAFNPERPLSFEEAKQQIIRELLVPEKDVRAYYEAHREEFDRPDSASLRYILVATREEARSVIETLNAGKDFADLAREVSLDAATRADGGLIPQLLRGRPFPLFAGTTDAGVFEEKAFSLPRGGLSEPFELSRGWAVIRVLNLTPGSKSVYDEVRARVQTMLFETRVREKEQEFYDSLELQIEVTRNEKIIQSYLEGAE